MDQVELQPSQREVQRALEILGGRTKMGRILGCSRVLLGMYLKGSRVPAEMAMKIQLATKHQVMAEHIRPDLPWREIRQRQRKPKG